MNVYYTWPASTDTANCHYFELEAGAETDVGLSIHGFSWVGLGWVTKLQLFVGWVGLSFKK